METILAAINLYLLANSDGDYLSVLTSVSNSGLLWPGSGIISFGFTTRVKHSGSEHQATFSDCTFVSHLKDYVRATQGESK